MKPLLVAACFVLAGCGGSDRPATAPVRGQVTYLGQPVAGATLAFLCTGAPRPAVATTDEAGNYQLTTFEPSDGAVIGTHVVTVNKYEESSESSLPAVDPNAGGRDMNKAISQAVRQSIRQMESAKKTKPPLPPKYSRRATSDLRKDVVDGDNVINIELTN